MKKLITASLLSSGLLLVNATSVLAASPLVAAPSGSVTGAENIQNIPQLVVNGLLMLATFLALVFLILGGIQWITSGGERQKVDSAKKKVTAAVIGLIISLGAFVTLNFVLDRIGVKNPLNQGIPCLQDPSGKNC